MRFSPPEEENLKVMFILRVVSGAHRFGNEDKAKSQRSVGKLPREGHPVNKAVCVCS